jgi:cytochrome c
MSDMSVIRVACGLAIAILIAAPPALGANATAGEAVFKSKCATCHTVDKGGKNGVGPNIFGIVGQKSAQVAGFTKYSAPFKAANITWTDDKLKDWITAPAKMVPGTKMLLIKPVTATEADDIVAYLNTKK